LPFFTYTTSLFTSGQGSEEVNVELDKLTSVHQRTSVLQTYHVNI